MQLAFVSMTGMAKANGATADEAHRFTEPQNANTITKNHEFYAESLDEINAKLQGIDSKFSLLSIVLSSRKGVDDLTKEKLADLLTKGKERTEDLKKGTLEERTDVELLRMLEESVGEKQKVYRLKRQFMDNIRKMKETQQAELVKLFDKLNQVEDEYLVTERLLSNLQTAIKQNTEEVRQVQSKIASADKEKHELEVEAHRLEEELQAIKNIQSQQASESRELTRRVADYESQFQSRLKEAEHAQARLVQEQLVAFENRQRLEFVENMATELAKDIQVITKDKAKREAELASKIQTLRDTVKNRTKSEDETERIKALLATIDGTDFSSKCFCEVKEDAKQSYFEIIYKASELQSAKQAYPYYEQMVADFLAKKDVN